jgi:tetratricopeptide (TPR) repeat protein
LNKRAGKTRFEQNQDSLLSLSDNLKQAENYQREGNRENNKYIKECLKQYAKVAQQFEELNDWETASYFHKRCLDVSVEYKYSTGEVNALKGLGICEEKVLNIFEAMNYMETAHENCVTNGLPNLEKAISKELVRVYQIIAIDFQEREEFNHALEYFEKCLQASQRANEKEKEAECYQRIGLIHDKLGDLDKAIACLTRFLEVCQREMKTGSRDKEGEAHKLLADVHAKNGNVQMAIHHLGELMNIAEAENKTQAQADAALQLGLLHY